MAQCCWKSLYRCICPLVLFLEEKVTQERNFLRPATLAAALRNHLYGLFFPGYLSHHPTKAKAPAYSFQGPRHRAAESCSPGPCCFVPPAVTRHGKHVGSEHHLGRRLPGNKTDVTPGPSE